MASFLGSFHCAGMCGPIVSIVGKDLSKTIFYHVGRLLGYLLIGLLAHQIGAASFSFLHESTLVKITPIIFGLTLMMIGILMFSARSFHMKLPSFMSRPYSYFLNRSSFLVGFFSFTLPCGWFYAFVFGAITINDPLKSSLMLFSFWLGTLPLLSLTPFLAHKFITPIRTNYPNVFPLIVFTLGLFLAGLSLYKLLAPQLVSADQNKFIAPLQRCELNKGPCKIISPSLGEIEIKIGPHPFKMNKPLKAEVNFFKMPSAPLVVEVDITGHEMDMGYNRPQFKSIDHQNFMADMILPTCIEELMEWRITFIFKNDVLYETYPFIIYSLRQ